MQKTTYLKGDEISMWEIVKAKFAGESDAQIIRHLIIDKARQIQDGQTKDDKLDEIIERLKRLAGE